MLGIALFMLSAGKLCAQQVVGSFPNIDAGFESQSPGNLPVGNPNTSSTQWSYVSSGNGQIRLITATGGNGGPQYMSVGKNIPTTNTSTTTNSNIISTGTFAQNTKYIIQFHYKQNIAVPDTASFVFISMDGTSAARDKSNITLGTPSAWTKFTKVVSTNGTTTPTSNGIAGINIKLVGLADGVNSAVVDVDNFVVYKADNQTTPVPDETAPANPGTASVANPTGTTLDINWGAAASTDGGGYMLVRYPSNPTAEPNPIANAVYKAGNTIGNGTIVYIGAATTYTNVQLTANTNYYFRVYTIDKAFNYSAPVTTSGSTNSNVVVFKYYIDGVAGDDNNAGTLVSPWKNISKLNSMAFASGTEIYLKSGSTWTGQKLKFSGSGVQGSPIKIDKYGTGANPILAGNGITGEAVVYLYNQQYIEISNLEITNSPNGPVNTDFFVGLYSATGTNPNPLGADRRGVMVALDNFGTANHIYLKNLNVHHIKGQLGNGTSTVNGAIPKRTGGIYFAVLGNTEQTNSKSRFNDVLIDSCNVNYCENTGIAFDNEWNVYYPGGTEYTNWYDRRFTNVKVSNSTIHHIGKNAMIIRCTDETGLIEKNVCYETALGTTGNTMFTARAKGTVFQYNEGYYNRSTTQTIDPGSIDGSMYDPDFGSIGIIFQYSYSHDNSEGIYWGCNTRGSNNNTTGIPDAQDTGCTLRYCVSQNDKGRLIFFNYSSAGNEIYNNVFYTRSGLSPTVIVENDNNSHKYNFYNNIVYNLSGSTSYAYGNGTGVQTRSFSNNLFYGNHPSSEPSTDPAKLISNPLLVSPGTATIGISTLSGYKLQPGSPALASGKIITNNGGHDLFGTTLPATAPNRGVYEGPGLGTVPVVLVQFDVNNKNGQAYLHWTTNREINSSRFEIEHSVDGINFYSIGSVTANVNSTLMRSYSFYDSKPALGVNYYRLKLVDQNGQFTYSEIKKINFSKTASIGVFPNPVKDIVNITIDPSVTLPLTATVKNLKGQRVINDIKINEHHTSLECSLLLTGMYIIEFFDVKTGARINEVSFIK